MQVADASGATASGTEPLDHSANAHCHHRFAAEWHGRFALFTSTRGERRNRSLHLVYYVGFAAGRTLAEWRDHRWHTINCWRIRIHRAGRRYVRNDALPATEPHGKPAHTHGYDRFSAERHSRHSLFAGAVGQRRIESYSWSVSFGSLPAGLSLNGATIAGTPSAAGTSGFTVQVADATGATASRPMSVTINAAALTITTASILPNGAVGTAYSQPVAASGGSGAYTWTLISGSLPPGLSLNGATISGKPTAAGAFGFTLQVSDATGATSVKQFAITVAGGALVITTTSLNDATLGVAYTQTIVVTGGTNLYSWSITSGQLPPGLVLASNGVIAGTPSAGGAYNFTVQVTDSSSAHTSASFTLTVRVPLTIVTQTVLATGSAGHAYSQSLVSQGGSGTVSWSLVSGSLPAGLTLHPNGVIDGVPAQVGSFSITIQAANASGATVSRAFTLSIVPA